ncbi:hypothetical protein NGRA_2773 [Nosema granulosis]|uniref:Uncharacterized protein n=1 Tax=Nosema granulosis TaxID=83296 RepID=A0A9P6KXE0_9MICR|nr:hypothetical protein NGRA_2773 [Nosema granulosis]
MKFTKHLLAERHCIISTKLIQHQSESAHEKAGRRVKRMVRCVKEKKKNVSKPTKCNPKRLYGYLNDRRVVRDNIGSLRNSAGHLKSSDANMPSFITVFTDEHINKIPEENINHILPGEVQPLENIHFLVGEAKEKLGKLYIIKSTGPDDQYSRIIRRLSVIVSGPLTEIFSRSMTTGIVPEDW